jgi:hypothetical protein
MTTNDQIASAHDDVVNTRARMADTVAQIEARVTGQMDAVKAKLDVVQMIRDNPWTAIAVATGVGAAISGTGSDRKAATAAVDAARQGATIAAEKAKQAGAATVDALKGAPSSAGKVASLAKGGILGYLDTLAASAVAGFIERIRSTEGR